jgi:hypothetical protein
MPHHTSRPNHEKHTEQHSSKSTEQVTSEAADVSTEQIQPNVQSMNPKQILQLQRLVGNRAVVSMLGKNKSTPNSIHRKFDGDLANKSDEEIATLLTEAGYKVGIVVKNKLHNLRKQDKVFSTLDSLAQELGFKPKSQPPVVSPVTETPPTVENGGTESQPNPSTQPVIENEEIQEDISGIGGGTTWRLDSKYISVDVSAKAGDPPQDFGQLALSYQFTSKGLEFHANVFSNPKLVWEQGDKVSVTLQFKNGTSHLIGDLRVQKTGNIVDLNGSITYADLAGLLKVELPPGNADKKREKLAEASVQMGILAMWRTKDDKGEQHRSGGIDQKGGSGLINVSPTPISVETLKKTEDENIRNIGWNENQIATPDRPLVKSFPNLIKLGEEIATTLEAESEYMVDRDGYAQILEAMTTISGTGKEDLLKTFGIVKEVKPSEKIYTDTYYDLATDDENDQSLPLLENNIVFRRREVRKDLNNGEGDPEGTNLIAIKGRSVKSGDEAIRLAAQFQSQYDLLDESQQDEVLEFLRSEQVDNPFARTLQDALGKNKGVLDTATHLKKSITVTSTRTKYKLWLADSTMIDLSVDKAQGEMDGFEKSDDHVVYSFEFGVGHPGLATGATGSGGLQEQDPKVDKLRKELSQYSETQINSKAIKNTQIKNRLEQTNKLIHRPYHVPKDLENESLFEKGDYQQYKNLRDTLIAQLFKMDKSKLERGGNKAKLLAEKIKQTEPV